MCVEVLDAGVVREETRQVAGEVLTQTKRRLRKEQLEMLRLVFQRNQLLKLWNRFVCDLQNFNATVEPPDKGPSQKGTTSQQRTQFWTLFHSSSSFLTSEKRTTFSRGQNGWFQSVPYSEVPL